MRRLLRNTLFQALVGGLLGAAATLLYLRTVTLEGTPATRFGALTAYLASIGFTLPVVAALLPWVALSVYWSVSARGAAAPRQAESRASRGVHVVLTTLAQVLVMLPVPGLRARFLPDAPWITAAGFVLMLASLALAVWARRVLGRFWSGAIATNTEHQLIRAGPYRRVRHPIYTGLLGLYMGTALVSGEWHALLGVVIALAAYWRKIRLEEQHLRALFGPAYETYARESGALLPRLF